MYYRVQGTSHQGTSHQGTSMLLVIALIAMFHYNKSDNKDRQTDSSLRISNTLELSEIPTRFLGLVMVACLSIARRKSLTLGSPIVNFTWLSAMINIRKSDICKGDILCHLS